MLRWGLAILGLALVLMLIIQESGGLGSCGPKSGMLPVLLLYMATLPIGALLTVSGLIKLAIDRFRHRKESGEMPRIISS